MQPIVQKFRELVGFGLILAAFGGFSTATSAADFAAAKTRVLESFEKHKSASADWVSRVVKIVDGTQKITDGRGTIELLKADGKLLSRMEDHKTTVEIGEKPKDEGSQRTTTSVSDGEYVTQITEAGGERNAFRSKPRRASVFDTAALLSEIERENTPTVLADEELQGTPTIVIEAVPTVVSNMEDVRKRRYYFAKNSGLVIRRIGYNVTGEVIESFELTNVKIDPPLERSRFELAIPPEIQLLDITKARPTSPDSQPSRP